MFRSECTIGLMKEHIFLLIIEIIYFDHQIRLLAKCKTTIYIYVSYVQNNLIICPMITSKQKQYKFAQTS